VTDEDVLAHAHRLARAYLDGVSKRHVGGSDPVALRRPLSDSGEGAVDVLEQLAADVDPGLVASSGPRYFGFVVGGSLPVALGADWLVSAWDQMCGMYSASPAVAVAEEIAAGWVLELLGLPRSASVGFVTGAQMANFSCLAAARGELLRRVGWDADAQGLFGAPPIEVLVGEEVHVTVLQALRYLGLGHDRVTRVGVDANGAMDPLALEGLLLAAKGRVLLCAQAGNVNTGACDPLEARSETSRLSTARGFMSMERSACGPPRRRASRAWWPAGTGATPGPSMRISGSTFPTTARSRSLRHQRRYRVRWR
jgi:glutamate/tyrosine decarboxylase-like PLP-dependent enzyme